MVLNRLKYGSYLVALLCLFSCSQQQFTTESFLSDILDGEEVVVDNVIACAANGPIDNLVNVFFYPRANAVNFQYFETETIAVDKNDFSNYTRKTPEIYDVFNGYLKRFFVDAIAEKWVIIVFDENDKKHLSNPIRLKHLTKPTEVVSQITIDTGTPGMPLFSWEDRLYKDSAIYFQVVADAENNLLSGTYTYEKMFQFYKLDNVVLNVTKETPAALVSGVNYGFTLMAVSEDNWVNLLAETTFSL